MPGKANLARLIVCGCTITLSTVKSGNFGHQVNSDINFQTVEIQFRRLIRIFTVCLVSLFVFQ